VPVGTRIRQLVDRGDGKILNADPGDPVGVDE